MTLGTRVAVMRDGTVQQVDTPQTLYREPANLFVAAFIGSPSMNLVEADGRRTTRSSSPASASRSARTRRPRGLASGSVILGIRPAGLRGRGASPTPRSRRSRSRSPSSRSSARRRTSSSRWRRRPSTSTAVRAASDERERATLLADRPAGALHGRGLRVHRRRGRASGSASRSTRAGSTTSTRSSGERLTDRALATAVLTSTTPGGHAARRAKDVCPWVGDPARCGWRRTFSGSASRPRGPGGLALAVPAPAFEIPELPRFGPAETGLDASRRRRLEAQTARRRRLATRTVPAVALVLGSATMLPIGALRHRSGGQEVPWRRTRRA